MNDNQWILMYMSLIRQYESEKNEAQYMMNNLMFNISIKPDDMKSSMDEWLGKYCLAVMKMEQLKLNYASLLIPPQPTPPTEAINS